MRYPFPLIILAIWGILLVPGPGVAAGGGEQAYAKARRAMSEGHNEQAVRHFTQAISENPIEPRYYNARGVAYKRLGKYGAAVADYEKALMLKPGAPMVLNNRGVAHLALKQYAKAIADFTAALSDESLRSKVYTNRGLAYAQQGRHQRAIQDYSAAIAARPLDHRSFVFMAESLEALKRWDKALKMYQLAGGLITDASLSATLEKRMAAIRKRKAAQPVDVQQQAKSPHRSAGPPAPADTPHAVQQGNETPQASVPESDTTRHQSASPALSAAQPESRGRTPSADGAAQRDQRVGAQSGPRPTAQSTAARDAGQTQAAGPARRAEEAPTADTSAPVTSSSDSGAGTFLSLDRLARKRYTKRMAPGVAKIYLQGRRFWQRRQYNQALVRFEDILQLSRRRKRRGIVGWMLVEIGRLHSKLGQLGKAASYFAEAVRTFQEDKVKDATLIALVELAQAKERAGLVGQAGTLYAKAAAYAIAGGHTALARQINETRSAQSAPVTRPPGKPDRAESNLAKVGRGPSMWGSGGKPTISTQAKRILGMKPSERAQGASRLTSISNASGPQPSVFRLPDPAGTADEDRTIDEHLEKLERLRKANNETGMIEVLDDLAAAYSDDGNYYKALHALKAAVNFHEKTGLTEGLADLLMRMARAQEELGQVALAAEHYSRSLYLASRGRRTNTQATGKRRLRKLLAGLGVDRDQLVAHLHAMWTARKSRDHEAETRALWQIARMYERAGREQDAVVYFDRASAAMLLVRASLHRKLGNREQAEKVFEQALEELKKVDYSRYLQLVKTPRIAGAVVD